MNNITAQMAPQIITIDVNKVSSVYVGKPHMCMCGCAGVYYYTSQNKDWSSKNRGYALDEDDINDAKVIRVIQKFVKDPQIADNIDNYIFTKVIGKTQYTIYMVKK